MDAIVLLQAEMASFKEAVAHLLFPVACKQSTKNESGSNAGISVLKL